MNGFNSWILIATVTLNTVLSHSLLKQALSGIAFPSNLKQVWPFVSSAINSPLIWISLFLQISGYIAWMAIISREKLAIAIAVSGAVFYLTMAGVGWLFFGEHLSTQQMLGLALLSLGVLLMVL